MKKKEINYSKEIPFIRRRYPHLNEEELREAEERFRQYVKLCLKIYRRLEEEERKASEDENFDETCNKN